MRLLYFVIIIGSLLFSCKSDTPNTTASKDNLQGKWEIIDAKRNGKQTELLKNGFFNFENNELTSNINLSADTITEVFTVTDNNIILNNSRYNVLYNTSDTLILSTRISNFDFEFTLGKQ